MRRDPRTSNNLKRGGRLKPPYVTLDPLSLLAAEIVKTYKQRHPRASEELAQQMLTDASYVTHLSGFAKANQKEYRAIRTKLAVAAAAHGVDLTPTWPRGKPAWVVSEEGGRDAVAGRMRDNSTPGAVHYRGDRILAGDAPEISALDFLAPLDAPEAQHVDGDLDDEHLPF